MKGKQVLTWVGSAALLLALLFAVPSIASAGITVTVKNIVASQGPKFMDPRLAELTHELTSVFKYSSYRLINEGTLMLRMKETGTVSLPGGRELRVTPMGVMRGRIKFRLVIFRGQERMFQTVVQLINNGSITLGGARHRGGYLLFNISASF